MASFEEMDRAASRALSDLDRILAEMEEEERRGAEVMFRWLRDNYRFAGYKRLLRPIMARQEADLPERHGRTEN